MEKVRFGIIGIGNIGTVHARYLLAGTVSDACLAAVCDNAPEKHPAIRQLVGTLPLFSDAQEMLQSGLIDAVIVATPHYEHPRLSMLAMRNGIHTLCEKPAGVYTAQVQEMNACARECDVVFGIMYNQRPNPLYQKVKDLIDSGELGEIRRSNWIITNWYRSQSYYNSGGWRATWEKEGGGCTLNHAVHHIDAIQWMLGFPSEVVAMMTNVAHDNAEVEDLSAAIFKYPSGAISQLTASVVHHGEDQKIIIQGDKARISAPWQAFASVSADNGFPQEDRDLQREAQLNAVFQETPKLEWTLHTGQINDLLYAIKHGTAPLVDGLQGKRSLELITAIYKSAITRSVVSLPIQRDDPFYRTGGTNALAPRFYEKSASVANFSEVGAIPLGKDLD